MKKAYEKPQILFCSFELSESISAGCDVITNFNLDSGCPVMVEDWGMTIITGTSCDYVPPSQNMDDYVCYHVPSDDSNVFTS